MQHQELAREQIGAGVSQRLKSSKTRIQTTEICRIQSRFSLIWASWSPEGGTVLGRLWNPKKLPRWSWVWTTRVGLKVLEPSPTSGSLSAASLRIHCDQLHPILASRCSLSWWTVPSNCPMSGIWSQHWEKHLNGTPFLVSILSLCCFLILFKSLVVKGSWNRTKRKGKTSYLLEAEDSTGAGIMSPNWIAIWKSFHNFEWTQNVTVIKAAHWRRQQIMHLVK